MAAHHEVHLETYVVNKLLDNGWVEGHAGDYDQVRTLYPADVLVWVKPPSRRPGKSSTV